MKPLSYRFAGVLCLPFAFVFYRYVTSNNIRKGTGTKKQHMFTLENFSINTHDIKVTHSVTQK